MPKIDGRANEVEVSWRYFLIYKGLLLVPIFFLFLVSWNIFKSPVGRFDWVEPWMLWASCLFFGAWAYNGLSSWFLTPLARAVGGYLGGRRGRKKAKEAMKLWDAAIRGKDKGKR